MAVNALAAGVFAPALKLTVERDKLADTGKAELSPADRLATARAMASWFGLIRCRCFAAKVWAADSELIKPMMLINNAEFNRPFQS